MNTDFHIVFLLPTCEPDEMFNWLYPSLDMIKGARDFISFAICFQPPYEDQQIKQVINKLDELGIDYKYIYKDYKVQKPYTPLIRMRNDCAMMYPDADAYALLDDDMSFTEERIVDVFRRVKDIMKENPKIGVIGLEDWRRAYENIFATNNGVIYRGGKYYGFQGVMPHQLTEFGEMHTLVPYDGEDLINLFGGFQDKFCAMVRLAHGDKGVQMEGTPTRHIENRKQRGAIGHGWDPAKYENGSIAKFIEKYFNPYFVLSMSMTLFHKDLMLEIDPHYFDRERMHETNAIELVH